LGLRVTKKSGSRDFNEELHNLQAYSSQNYLLWTSEEGKWMDRARDRHV
jgi:hypothetical protein